MDNLTVHKSQFSQEFFAKCNINILFNGYLCECNFIEYAFGLIIKKKLVKVL